MEDGEIFWVTDDCYFDFPRGPPAPHMARQFELLVGVCKPPPQGGGDSMLEALTRDYLRKAPER